MIRWTPELSAAERDAILGALGALRAGAPAAGLELVSERLLRRVARLVLPSGRPVYLKLHRLPRLRDRVRYALRRLPGSAEFAALRVLSANGFRVPRPLACAAVREGVVPRESWLVTEGITPGGSEVTCAEALALVDRLAVSGWHHPDLHPANFLRGADGEVVLLDLQSLRRARPGAARSAMRARCVLGFAQRDGESLEATAARLRAGGLMTEREAPAVIAAAARIHARWLLARARRPWIESSGFHRTGGWRATWSRRGYEFPRIQDASTPVRVGAWSCALSATSDPGVLALSGPASLRACWPGDAWRVFTTGGEPRVVACQRAGPWPWSRWVVLLRASRSEWPEVVDRALKSQADVRSLARSYRRREASPCVTLLLGAGYNPTSSVPSAHL